MKLKHLLCIGLFAIANIAVAATISPSEAMALANDALNRDNALMRAPSALSMEICYSCKEYYIINSPNGGWAVVGSEDRIPQPVLAYSFIDSLYPETLPEEMKVQLSLYAHEIDLLQSDPDYIPIPLTSSSGKSVAPLLGETAWSQGAPYNNMCPVLDGVRAATGCVNTAIAQIMYYHQHPAKGCGSISYEWNGMTLSADFSKSVYRWDLMQPFYDGDEAAEQEEAVALLMRDCGYANKSSYGKSTGANLNENGLVTYFDYDCSINIMERNHCSRDDYENTLRAELDAGRPVSYGGGSSHGAHEFVCDGYDANGYFHFNFGWGPGSQGFYLTSATGYDSSPYFTFSIMPNQGGIPGITGGSEEDFAWTSGNNIGCSLIGRIPSEIFSTIEVALALYDSNSVEVKYYIQQTYKDAIYFNVKSIDFNDVVADGNYIIRPVYRIEGQEWKNFTFKENRINHIELTVRNGVKSYNNPEPDNTIDPGVEFIDGIYYRFENGEAIVTRRNERGHSYSGDVMIPAFVSASNKVYPVTKVDKYAMEECSLGEVFIGAEIRCLDFASFSGAAIRKLTFASESKLETIGGWAFNGARINDLLLPEGLYTISTAGFQSCGEKKLELPSTLNYIAGNAFCANWNLRDIYVHWETEECVPKIDDTVFSSNDVTSITLHVPENTKELYENEPEWSRFNIIDDVESGINSITYEDMQIVYRNGNIEISNMPAGVVAELYTLSGSLVGRTSSGIFAGIKPGVYIVRVGSHVCKAVI